MAFSNSISCPSCGVAVDDVSAHTRSMQCPHCANWIYISGNGWASGGSFEHALDAPSFLRVGRSGHLVLHESENRQFIVVGRLRVSYPEGYWDEWWLEFEDGNHQWLEEDEGRYRLHSVLETNLTSAQLRSVRVGGMLALNGDNWFVSERLEAELAGTEGALPIAVQPSEKYLCVTAMGSGEKISVEASGTDVTVTRSVRISGSDIVWNNG